MLPLGSISRRPRAGISFLLQEDLRHLISRLRRQLLLEEKPYMVRIAQQCFRNLAKGEISPCEAGFHLPKGDFTPATSRDFTLPKGVTQTAAALA